MSPLSFARRSFVYRRLLDAGMSFAGIGDASLGEHSESARPGAELKLVDLSVVPRWGLKGRDVSSWLDRQGAAMPRTDNRAELQRDGSLIARLSPGEVLILAPLEGRSSLAAAIERLPAAGEGACYPVPRRDSHCWFVVIGGDSPAMFAKLCGVDLAPDRFFAGQIAQTSVARLSAIVIRHEIGSSLVFSVLVESASAEYLWDCFLDAMTEFAGVVCGAGAIRPAPPCPTTASHP
jgi:sarcosine oxidase subunit gamma